MMLMPKLPPTMDVTIQVYTSGLMSDATTTALQKITLAGVRNAIIMHWEQRQGRHQTRGNNNIRKISTVKRKGPDPTFHQQQYHPHPQQQSNQQHPQGQQQNRSGCNHGTRAGCGRNQQQGVHQHTHFAHTADAPTTTITQGLDGPLDPRTLMRKPMHA